MQRTELDAVINRIEHKLESLDQGADRPRSVHSSVFWGRIACAASILFTPLFGALFYQLRWYFIIPTIILITFNVAVVVVERKTQAPSDAPQHFMIRATLWGFLSFGYFMMLAAVEQGFRLSDCPHYVVPKEQEAAANGSPHAQQPPICTNDVVAIILIILSPILLALGSADCGLAVRALVDHRLPQESLLRRTTIAVAAAMLLVSGSVITIVMLVGRPGHWDKPVWSDNISPIFLASVSVSLIVLQHMRSQKSVLQTSAIFCGFAAILIMATKVQFLAVHGASSFLLLLVLLSFFIINAILARKFWVASSEEQRRYSALDIVISGDDEL